MDQRTRFPGVFFLTCAMRTGGRISPREHHQHWHMPAAVVSTRASISPPLQFGNGDMPARRSVLNMAPRFQSFERSQLSARVLSHDGSSAQDAARKPLATTGFLGKAHREGRSFNYLPVGKERRRGASFVPAGIAGSFNHRWIPGQNPGHRTF